MEVFDTLSPPQVDLWNAYIAAEQRGVRSECHGALRAFLDSLESVSQAKRNRWALWLAAQVVDEQVTIPIRMPLFREAVFPSLEVAVAERVPGAARWLAGFTQHFSKCSDLHQRLADGTLTEYTLLKKALEHDSNDNQSRQKLLDLLAAEFRHSLHELPSGVLYGQNGASVHECQEMREHVDEFIFHAERLGVIDRYSELLAECRLHYRTYADYLTDREGAKSYQDFLSNRETC